MVKAKHIWHLKGKFSLARQPQCRKTPGLQAPGCAAPPAARRVALGLSVPVCKLWARKAGKANELVFVTVPSGQRQGIVTFRDV